MQGHSHPNGASRAPGFDIKRPLGIKGGLECLRGRGESRLKSISYHLVGIAFVFCDCFAQDGLLAGVGSLHGLGALLPELRAAFYIGEQECDRATGQVPHVVCFLDATRRE